MRYINYFVIIHLLFLANLHAQNPKDEENLDEVLINATRIEVPFSKESKNIIVINSSDIEKSTVTNLTDLLQNIVGVDVIKRGTNGMQSDIKIRGGNFQQTLILIDGFKTEDPQTGHHTMNMMIPLESIERIEIIKGASARIFGQNAFSGAINIVTKKKIKKLIDVAVNTGSFEYFKGSITAGKKFKKSSHFLNLSHQQSEGYRFNTDFKNNNLLLKSSFTTSKEPINLLVSFADRKFGAQFFYTSPASNFTEYEETQTSLVGLSTKYIIKNFTIKPKVYWKRNQDEFLLKRGIPDFSRNHNISNKVGVELNSSYQSETGITGVGVDVARVSLSSNNLGNHNRIMINAFFEHRYVTKNKKIDFTPGISMSYFSDFGKSFFPGLDVGFKVKENTRMYWNIGSSYRVPTYTELYINIPNFLSGNTNLNPEKAFSQEFGLVTTAKAFSFNAAVFYRVSNDLIDYVKETDESPFYKAENLRTITTKGIELNSEYQFNLLSYPQKVKIGYTFLEDDYGTISVFKSRYLLNNTIKHHLTLSIQTQFLKNIKQTFSYRYIERPINTYHVIDAKVSAKIKKVSIFILANNILDESYYEKIFISMPKSNFELGVKYTF